MVGKKGQLSFLTILRPFGVYRVLKEVTNLSFFAQKGQLVALGTVWVILPLFRGLYLKQFGFPWV